MSDEEHECPECGDVFPTERGLLSHHGQIHDGSIAGVEITCEACGDVLSVPPSESDRKYCSVDCMRVRVTVTCAACGDLLQRIPSRVENHEQQFCDQECAGEWRSGRPNELLQVQRIEKPCSWCGDAVSRRPSHPDVENWFCDGVCYGKYVSEHNVGDGNPNWEGGYDPYYGPNWCEQRRKVWKRDSETCQACGQTTDELDQRPSVHHIIPFQEFHDYEEANELSNLVCLCRSCHGEWEGIPLRPDTAPVGD